MMIMFKFMHVFVNLVEVKTAVRLVLTVALLALVVHPLSFLAFLSQIVHQFSSVFIQFEQSLHFFLKPIGVIIKQIFKVIVGEYFVARVYGIK